MCRAVSILLQKFPDIRRDLTRANQDPKPFIAKVRKVCSDNTHTVGAIYTIICVAICAKIFANSDIY